MRRIGSDCQCGVVMKKIILLFMLGLVLLCLAGVFHLFSNGVLWFNNPSRADFPVRGVDVSEYQGDIDWQTLAAQDIQFAFIKATEGSGHVDPMLEQNLQNAQKTELMLGFYHFFSFDSSGFTQAENFIAAVPRDENMMPPVVDIELYGDHRKSPPHAQSVFPILDALLGRLTAHYGKKPILYATSETYLAYIRGRYEGYPLWIRSVIKAPSLPNKARWTFWQYKDRETLPGYKGRERFIDMNVFYGTPKQFEAFVHEIVEPVQEPDWSLPDDESYGSE